VLGRRGRRKGRGSRFAAAAGVLAAALYVFSAPSPATSTTTTTTTAPTTTTTAPGTTTSSPASSTTTSIPTHVTHLRWPSEGSAAVAIPQLSVEAVSTPQSVQAIASLSKLMTAWVALHLMPLAVGQSGPCEVMSKADVALYVHDVTTGQSNVAVGLGETLCESQLLQGLFVHSAGDFAVYLVQLSGVPMRQFVNLMNRDARVLGMSHTHYVEPTGINPADRSTALDQLTLVLDLLRDEPIVDAVASLTHATFPVAGSVGSYTPYIGNYGVIGVKSGVTGPAGGCDVMLRRIEVDGQTVYTYAVVLGQHQDDPLAAAGNAALALSRSLVPSIGIDGSTMGPALAWIGSPSDVVTTTTTTTTTLPTTTSTTSTSTTTSTTTTVP
jgi:serine-type D-Ala-D-Ala carboxypeptidase (penicillin-binding protein 5/6)